MITQKGFTLVEGLLIVLILSVVGFAGYTVWNNQKDDETEITNYQQCVDAGNPIMESFPPMCSANGQTFTENINQPELDIEENEQIEEVSTETDELVEYTYAQGGLIISHPNTWTTSVEQEGNLLVLKSADFEVGTEEYVAVNNGELLEIFVNSSDSNIDALLTSLKEAKSAHGGEYKEIKVDGERAVFSTIKTHGSHVNTFVYKNGNEYLFRYDTVNLTDLRLEEKLLSFLSTVRFL
jgi:Tfp pilus assembly protein PilE